MSEEKNKEHEVDNKSSIYVLIISFLIIIILLLVTIVFLLKRDTSVPLPVVDEIVEKELVITDELKLELSNKMYLLLGGYTLDSYNSNNRFGSSSFNESLLINQFDDYDKQFIVVKNLDAVKDTSGRWMEHENIKRIIDFDPSMQGLAYYGTISFDKYNNFYKDLFLNDAPAPIKVVGSCPEYYYSDTYKEFYKITYVCGVVSYGDNISYISNYEIDEKNIYLYMNFGFMEPGYGDKTLIYGNFEEYEVSGSKGIKPINVVEEIDYQLTNSYVINDTNKDKFSEYKITFKNVNNKYYYEKIEKIK